jgi:DNA-binding MurR/RpiR family transcriptional regulator
MSTFQERIKNSHLTKTEKRIADYILDNYKIAGVTSAVKIAFDLKISDTSIHRFVRKLGYSSFANFKTDLNQEVISDYHRNWETLSPGQKYLNKSTNNDESIVESVIQKAIININKSKEHISELPLEKISEVIINAKHKFVFGFRGSSSLAAYFYRKMTILLPFMDAILYYDSEIIEKIMDLTSKDVIIMYTFPRYSEINKTILNCAKNRGAQIILFTDKITSPLAKYADYLVPVEIEGVGGTNSYVAPMCISEIIILMVSNKLKFKDKKRIEQLDELINKHNLY